MNKLSLIIMSLIFSISITSANLLYSTSGAVQAFSSLDCEFENCQKPLSKALGSKRVYNKAFFDIETKTTIHSHISYTTKNSFNIEEFVNGVNKFNEAANIVIYGSIAVPKNIISNQVFIHVGPNFHYSHWSGWKKEIYYNDLLSRQNSNHVLVNTKTDAQGQKYVDYKIIIYLTKPWQIKLSEQNVAPNTFFFKVAPKTKDFENKFLEADIYILK